ncbi:hypothetical protein AGLY_015533 [Aphis glycines]|uniref:Reverse transcriptase domain-containing protein n=1 Tax=Aphis glycines TaxID=307491 RepID=A0A6G0T0L9_APHGL|nr:hypothetical protein AGLY_015533 [Aphis glycines]
MSSSLACTTNGNLETKINKLTYIQLTEVINENNLLKDKVQQLKIKLSGLESGQINIILQGKLFSKFINRESRTRNIVLFNVPEFSSTSCSLRIVLPSPSGVFEILKVKRKLLNVTKFTSVCISTDRTPLQQNYFKSILSEIISKRDNGENDLIIKYINNIPTISKNYQSSAPIYQLTSNFDPEHFSNLWRHTNIVLIPKPIKNKFDIKNYRPISFISTLSKLIKKHTEICLAFRRNENLITIALNITKTYDIAWKKRVLTIFHSFKINGNLFIFIKNFLKDRKI